MTEKTSPQKKSFSADWFMQGALVRIGDTLDRFTGRKWVPASSLATSGLIERLKRLLDAEAREVAGKGLVVPHHIILKMQWDKFSADAEEPLETLRNELLAAAADHVNDQHYYTAAPLELEVKRDYFTEGVKLFVSFDKFDVEEGEATLDVTMPAINVKELMPTTEKPASAGRRYLARFTLKGMETEYQFTIAPRGRLSVGRIGSNDLVLDDTSVSKMHASVVADETGLSVADTGSTNGTFVNDQRIAYGLATRLEEGDRIKYGDIEVVFEQVPEPMENEMPVAAIESDTEVVETAAETEVIADETLKLYPKTAEAAQNLPDAMETAPEDAKSSQ